MCRIFVSQDPRSYACVTRSVRLAGHCTSLRLERMFWDILGEIAAGQNLTVPRFLSTLHGEIVEDQGEVANFASLLRIACVIYLKQARGVPDRPDEPALAWRRAG